MTATTQVAADALTYLFVPGNRPERFAKALASGADRVILDLEDAVASADKAAARSAVAQWLHSQSGLADRLLVRINDDASPWYADDLALLAASPLRCKLTGKWWTCPCCCAPNACWPVLRAWLLPDFLP